MVNGNDVRTSRQNSLLNVQYCVLGWVDFLYKKQKVSTFHTKQKQINLKSKGSCTRKFFFKYTLLGGQKKIEEAFNFIYFAEKKLNKGLLEPFWFKLKSYWNQLFLYSQVVCQYCPPRGIHMIC